MYKLFDNSLEYSGNNTTINRLSKILNLEITNKIQDNLIGIHAYKFGNLVNKNLNYIIILGGTDINEYLNKHENKIKKSLLNARHIVSFNTSMKKKIIDKLNIDKNKISIIAQSVGELKCEYFDLSSILDKDKYKKIFIIVGNLREVKDPTYLFKFFERNKIYALILIGKIIEGKYSFTENIYHINGLKKEKVYSIMTQVDGLINCSKSEGMAISILEAMKLKCPIYARENEGNKEIIINNYNGFLFKKKSEFDMLLNLDTNKIIKNAYNYVNLYHNSNIEKTKYELMLKNL